MGKYALQCRISPGIAPVIQGNKKQRSDYGSDGFVFQFDADSSHHPSKNTGQSQDENGQHQEKKYIAKNHGHRKTSGRENGIQHNPVGNYRGNEYNGLVNQAPHPYTEQTDKQDRRGVHRHGQEEFIVFCHIQGCVGVEHTAEYTQQNGHKTHNGKVQPVKPRQYQRLTEHIGYQEKCRTHADKQGRIYKKQKRYPLLSAFCPLFLVLNQPGIYLHKLFF